VVAAVVAAAVLRLPEPSTLLRGRRITLRNGCHRRLPPWAEARNRRSSQFPWESPSAQRWCRDQLERPFGPHGLARLLPAVVVGAVVAAAEQSARSSAVASAALNRKSVGSG